MAAALKRAETHSSQQVDQYRRSIGNSRNNHQFLHRMPSIAPSRDERQGITRDAIVLVCAADAASCDPSYRRAEHHRNRRCLKSPRARWSQRRGRFKHRQSWPIFGFLR